MEHVSAPRMLFPTPLLKYLTCNSLCSRVHSACSKCLPSATIHAHILLCHSLSWKHCRSLADQDCPTPPRRAGAALPRLDLVPVNVVMHNNLHTAKSRA